jgi:hypothetical protein
MEVNFLTELVYGHSDVMVELEGDVGGEAFDKALVADPVGAVLEKNQNDRFVNAGPPRRVWRGIEETDGVMYVEDALAKLIGLTDLDGDSPL